MGIDNKLEDGGEARFNQQPSPRILVVADEKTNLHIKEYLALEPYRAQYVTCNQAALKRIQQHEPSLLLCDTKLPHEEGHRHCEELSSFIEYNIPTILLVAGKHSAGLIRESEARSIDYLKKPFTRHELLARIRSQMAVLSARDRLARLREFVKQIARVHDLDTLMYRVFTHLQEESNITDVTLFKDNSVLYSSSADISTIKYLFNRADGSNHTDGCYTLCRGEFDYLFFRISDVMTWTFVVRVSGLSFLDIEKEYIQNVIQQVMIINSSLRKNLCNPGDITNLYNILSKSDKILFIKSAKQYVEIYTKNNRPELLTISLKMVGLYLKEQLMKVHRSYLINPKEIKKIRRKKQGRYEIIMKDHVIPIGEVYLPMFHEKYTNLFKNDILI